MKINRYLSCRLNSIISFCFVVLLTSGCLPPVPVFVFIEGDLTGLNPGESLTLELNAGGSQTLLLFDNGSFDFPVEVESGTPYSVTATNIPIGRQCEVSGGNNFDGTGTLGETNLTDILVECADILISDVYIPDQGLRDCVDDTALAAEPDLLVVAELTALECDGNIYPITDTTGLEVFNALTALSIFDNTSLSSVDLSKLVNLATLQLALTNMNQIDISHNVLLLELYLQLNFLTTINLDANLLLEDVQILLNCWDADTLTYLSGLSYTTFNYLPNREECPVL